MYKYTRKKQQIETAVNNAMRELFYHVKYEDALAYARYVKHNTGIDIGVCNCDSASYNCGSFIPAVPKGQSLACFSSLLECLQREYNRSLSDEEVRANYGVKVYA